MVPFCSLYCENNIAILSLVEIGSWLTSLSHRECEREFGAGQRHRCSAQNSTSLERGAEARGLNDTVTTNSAQISRETMLGSQ